MTTPDRQVRLYRRLVALYPQRFREEYAADMVVLFEDMLRDGSTVVVWQRTLRDLVSSVLVLRMESFMSQPRARFAGVMTCALLAVAVTGLLVAGTDPVTFFVPVVIAFAASCLALFYWVNNRSYVEPSKQMHQHWKLYLGLGVGFLAAGVIAVNVLGIDGPWELLIGDVLAGWALVGVGVALGIWHGAYRVRSLRTA